MQSASEADTNCYNDMTLNKLVFKLMEEHKGLFILYGLILLCVPLRDILMPRLVGSLYDAIRGGKQLEIIIIGIVAIIVIIQIMSVVSDFIDVKLHPAIYKLVREEMTKHIFSVKENNYSEVQIGDIVSKIIKLPGVIHHHIELIRETIIPSIITVLCILGYMFYIDPVLAIPLIIFICIFVGTLIYSSEKCSPVAFKKDETHSLIMSNTDDILRNMITILSFNKIDAEFERINQIHKAYEVHTMDTLNCSLRSKYIIIPCIITFMIFTWYYTYKKVVTKEVSSGTFLTIVIISFMLMNLVLSFLRAWQHILLRNGIIENSLQVFQECKVTRQPYTKPAESTAGIRFQNVDFSYVSTDISPLQPSVKRPIFKDFNLDINLYEKTLIIGEIGSGKSTIISLLLKYQTPQGGEIFLKGVPYSTIPNSTVRKNISYIPQSPILLNRSVYENIVYGITPEPSKEEVAKLIIDMKLSKFLDGLPKGLDTSVGVHGSKLSGGQKQITWILKAILINPEIIIMDEPTSAVDDETKGIIHFLLEKVMQGKTVIMITHDPYLLKFANRVIKLKDGKVVS
jgi:ATP-binding cassette subfamily B protein